LSEDKSLSEFMARRKPFDDCRAPLVPLIHVPGSADPAAYGRARPQPGGAERSSARVWELDALSLSSGPLPAVLDTDFIRTGLHDQLSKGTPPKSVRSVQDGSLRLFMEYDTLAETGRKLPKFADQLGVSAEEPRRTPNEDWLPNIDVVRLPPQRRAGGASPRWR
jgi:hypothetical protein